MRLLIDKFLGKLEAQRLARREDAVFLALDADLYSNRPVEGDGLKLRKLFDLMNIGSLLFAEPAEPYRSIIREIVDRQMAKGRGHETTEDAAIGNSITPMDSETRTFFHDIPVVDDLSPEKLAVALSRRKSVIVKDRGILSYGVVTPEQAFVSFSSTCFSTFVKYFYDCLVYFETCHHHRVIPEADVVSGFRRVSGYSLHLMPRSEEVALMTGPPRDEEEVLRMLSEAGRAVVEHHLVDSYFGNVSFVYGKAIFISQTGSSMDELECCVDAVPLDGSSSAGITASSELSAHKSIYEETAHQAILHGHPKFPVVLSMHCSQEGCDRSECYTSCREKRYVAGIPIVPGEIGTGPRGLLHTVPAAMKEGKGVIVYGHGVFTSGKGDFRGPFSMLLNAERSCREEYFRRVRTYLGEG